MSVDNKVIRASNIELLRLFCMFLIVAGHVNYLIYGIPSKNELNATLSITSFRVISYQLCVVAVNCFVFISGWFSIKSNYNKGVSLILQTLEYGIGISLLFYLFGYSVPQLQFIRLFFIGEYYWFIIAYLQLFILAPVLNSFTESASQHVLKLVVLVFLAFEFIYGWVGGVGNFADGYSGIHFVGLYLLARYIRKYVDYKMITQTKAWIYYLAPVVISYIIIVAGGGILLKNGFIQR